MKNTIQKIVGALLFVSLASCSASNEVCSEQNTPRQKEVDTRTVSTTGIEKLSDGTPSEPRVQTKDNYRWYALENKDNVAYWEAVDCNRIWVELTIGSTLNSSKLAEFLVKFNLSEIDRSSNNPTLTNYFVFKTENSNKEKVIEMAEAAKEVDAILFLEPASKYVSDFEPNDFYWNQQWGPYTIYADEAWEYTTGGSFNVIAVIDDAVDYSHEDLVDQVQYGWDYGFNDADPYPDVESQIHGTHVTGTIAASINNGLGIAGMVNDTIYFAKVTDASYDPQFGNFSDVAIVDALYDIATIDRVGTINMSLGAPTPSAALEEACNFAWAQGKLLIAASGNDGTNVISFPAAYGVCMAVGSIGTDGNNFYLADYSQYGNQQEVVAPGGDMNTGFGILSTTPGNNYEFLQGTSMATPHVVGVAGLIQAYDPSLSNEDVRSIIQQSCFDLGDSGWDPVFGYGIVNALNALVLAESGGNVAVSDQKQMAFSTFPNPCYSTLTVQLEAEQQAKMYLLSDVNGNQVKSGQIFTNTASMTLDLSLVNTGVYMLTIYLKNGDILNSRIIKI